MPKYFFIFILFLSLPTITAWAGESVVVKQVGADNIKFIKKTPEELQNSDDGAAEEKNTDKTDVNKNVPPTNLAVPERERTNIIINQQNQGQNKANINNIDVKKNGTEELLKEEKKNVKRARSNKNKKKSKIISDDENK